MKFHLTSHARFQMHRRGITEKEVMLALKFAEQKVEGSKPGRIVYQRRFTRKDGRVYLLRVIVDTKSRPADVITAYWTSDIDRYWRKSHESDF